MKTKTQASPLPSEPEPASLGEIEQAIRDLTPEETERIRQSAQNRVFWIGRPAANGRDAGDLIQEALERILDGTRRWYKDRVAFTPYLIGVIWSLASKWAGYRQRNKKKNLPEYAALESELTTIDKEGRAISPFDGLADQALDPEDALISAEAEAEREGHSKAFMDKIEAEFAEDETAALILAKIQDGTKRTEIREALEMSDTEFKAAVRRIQRHVKKIMEQP